MWAGTSALQSINQTLATMRNESLRLDGQLAVSYTHLTLPTIYTV